MSSITCFGIPETGISRPFFKLNYFIKKKLFPSGIDIVVGFIRVFVNINIYKIYLKKNNRIYDIFLVFLKLIK